MPCDAVPVPTVERALARLEAFLANGRATVVIGPQGAVAFSGWDGAAREGVADVCAYRALSLRGSFALRQAVQRAEMLSGRRLNAQAIGGGVHSHDGGATWNPGH